MSILVQSFVALRIGREGLGATPNTQDDFARTISRYRNRDTAHHPGEVFIHQAEAYPRVEDRRPAL